MIFALVLSLSVLAPAGAADLTQAEKERFRDTAIVVSTVKASLRNPESVKWELIEANDDASVVCIRYRAQNGFGGMGREITVYANGKTSQSVAAWNKHCANRLNDICLVGGYVDKDFRENDEVTRAGSQTAKAPLRRGFLLSGRIDRRRRVLNRRVDTETPAAAGGLGKYPPAEPGALDL